MKESLHLVHASNPPMMVKSFGAGQGSIADQLLVGVANPQSMDEELSLDVGNPVLQLPKQAAANPVESTPLDDCLAQLTSETAPSLRIPGSDGESLDLCQDLSSCSSTSLACRQCFAVWRCVRP